MRRAGVNRLADILLRAHSGSNGWVGRQARGLVQAVAAARCCAAFEAALSFFSLSSHVVPSNYSFKRTAATGGGTIWPRSAASA
jgi:hypothetical protein